MTSSKFEKNFPQNNASICYLVTTHSFSGRDTVSNVYGFGKVKILKRLCQDNAPKEFLQTFNKQRATKEEISKAGVKLFQCLYNKVDTPLNQLRYDKYNTL